MTSITRSGPPDRPRRGHVFLVIRRLAALSGGAERIYCELATVLVDEGFEVTCLTYEASDAPPFYPIPAAARRVNLRRGRRPHAGHRLLARLAKFYPDHAALAPVDWVAKNLRFLTRLHGEMRRQRPDVVISFMPPANTLTLLAGAVARARVIPTNHSVPADDYGSALRWNQNPIDRFLRLHTLRFATRVHVLFPSFAIWFPDEIAVKTVAIPNHVSSEFTSPAGDGRRGLVIAAVGRLTPVKNLACLIEAWSFIAAQHPGWTVKLYGAGPQRVFLEDQVRALGVEGRVAFVGEVRDIRSALLEAEILAHPALFEGFGLAAAEALACGVPVVAFSDCSGLREFVTDGNNGLLVDRAGGATALADALDRVIRDRDLRAKLRSRAPGSVTAYSFEAFRARWIALVDEVITGRPPT